MGDVPGDATLTYLFTDVEGSTRLWERHPEAMQAALARHDAILRAAVEGCGGTVVKTTGDGLMAVFGSAPRRDHCEPYGAGGAARRTLGRDRTAARTHGDARRRGADPRGRLLRHRR